MSEDLIDKQQKNRQDVLQILQKNKLLSEVVHNQDMPHHDLVETLVRKQNLMKLDQVIEQMEAGEVACFWNPYRRMSSCLYGRG